MKITACTLISAVATLVVVACSKQEKENSTDVIGLWQEGKIAYEISQEFVGNELNSIKEALLDIMKATCITFVPHTNEPDYVVFVEYKHPNQEKGTCWSGNEWNNGTSTVGNKKGRHIFSLWRHLECSNKLDIIRELFKILGSSKANSSSLIHSINGGRKILNIGAYQPKYEENIFLRKKEISSVFNISACEKDLSILKKYLYAFDNQTWASIAKRDSCSVLRSVNRINQMYKCLAADALLTSNATANLTVNDLHHSHPNCEKEAERGACKSDPVYMSIVCGKTFCDGLGVTTPPSPRMVNLLNALGKCAAVDGNYNMSGSFLLQWDCYPNQKGQIWSWNQASLGSADRHLCNGHGKCAASIYDSPFNGILIQWDPFDQEGQRYYFIDSPTRPGFYLIKNDHGRCLSALGNYNWNGVEIHVRDCNATLAGQNWKWNT